MGNKLAKVQKRLKARQEAWQNTPSKETLSSQGLHMNKPGSQNRKK